MARMMVDCRDVPSESHCTLAIAGDEMTPLFGQTLARLPLDPRIGRMILAAAEEGCLHEVLVIAAALALVLPLVKWLLDHGVVFHYGTEVTDVDFNIAPGRKQATRIHWRRDGVEGGVDLGPALLEEPGEHAVDDGGADLGLDVVAAQS